jgi:AcrR family transcriptional regulator
MENTKEKVIEAAIQIFIKKGYGGARMQEIADRAGINKGLLHYYFKSKENLFHAVMLKVMQQIAPQIDLLINSEEEIRVKVRQFVELYIDILIQNPHLPAFVLAELNMNGEFFVREIFRKNKINPMKLILQIQMEIADGKLKPVNPFNLLVNILSMCIFPFIARPIFREIAGLSEDDYMKLMVLRKKEVTDFILGAIVP